MQRPCGENSLGELEEQQEGQCGGAEEVRSKKGMQNQITQDFEGQGIRILFYYFIFYLSTSFCVMLLSYVSHGRF